MKLTIKLKSTEHVRPLINFIQELTEKNFKEIKTKNIEAKEKQYLKFPKMTIPEQIDNIDYNIIKALYSEESEKRINNRKSAKKL